MNKAVFLDRDGTLIHDDGFVHKVEDFKFQNNATQGLKLLKEKYKFFIITNQSGLALKKFTNEDLTNFNNHLINELKNQGIEIKKIYFCPHHPEENCECRKPNTKLIKQAEHEFNIDLKNSFMIGDKSKDCEMGNQVGTKSILVLTGYGQQFKDTNCNYIAQDLLDAANWILKND
tara:strand:- start:4864 stop:5388 length:525 start_codon:yes stop_codon:yes gene_type:complete